MGLQLTIPFTMLPNGSVSTQGDPAVQVQQRVDAIISTEEGQRAMRSTFGVPLSRLLFNDNDAFIAAEIATEVTQQLNIYEPGINVISVTPNTTQSNEGMARVNVAYSPVLAASSASAIANVVTIEAGGTVVEKTSVGSGA